MIRHISQRTKLYDQKNMLKIILIAIPIIVVVFLIIVTLQPSTYGVTRSLAIAAPQEAVFPHMNELKKWEAWNPWARPTQT
jgi:heme/copper-type cytochrome/quinol oxidase subunit 2